MRYLSFALCLMCACISASCRTEIRNECEYIADRNDTLEIKLITLVQDDAPFALESGVGIHFFRKHCAKSLKNLDIGPSEFSILQNISKKYPTYKSSQLHFFEGEYIINKEKRIGKPTFKIKKVLSWKSVDDDFSR